MRTVFFGSGSFALPILDAVADDPRLALAGVVTSPDRPAGRARLLRSTPVAERARALGLPLLQPGRVREPDAVAEVLALQPDLGVLADYGQIVPRALLDAPRLGILNVHPSLLPRHRGATPVAATIREGDRLAGVSVFRMDAGVDTGPVLAIESWPLDGTETAPALEEEAARRGAGLLLHSLDGYLAGTAALTPQDGSVATLTRPFRREDARLDPSRPAIELERSIRAQQPWPGAFLETEAGRVLVHRASLAPGRDGDVEGELLAHEGRPAVATSEGRLVLDVVQLAGKRPVTGEDFLRGHGRLVGTRVRGAGLLEGGLTTTGAA